MRRKRPVCCPGPYKCSSESSEDGPSILEETIHFSPRKLRSALPLIPSTKTSGRKGRKTTLREHLSCTRCFLIHYHSFSLHCAIRRSSFTFIEKTQRIAVSFTNFTNQRPVSGHYGYKVHAPYKMSNVQSHYTSNWGFSSF